MYTSALLNGLGDGLQAQLGKWGLSERAHVRLLTASENATFLATDPADGRKMVIRVHRPDYHSLAEIESELHWITAVRSAGAVNTPSPLTAADGSYLVPVEAQGREFQTVAFEFVAGREPDVGESLPDWFERLGAVTARLHQHTRQWQRPAGFVRKQWHLETMIGEQGYWGDWRNAIGLQACHEQVISDAVALISERIAGYGRGADRYGLVHADLRLANLLVDGEQLSIIDFDDCGFCWYAYDFAAAISFYELDPLVPELRKSWVKGYRSVAQFSDADEQAISTFIMMRRIMLSAWLAGHAETDTGKELGPGYIDGTASLARDYLNGAF
ncbi:phosphotransferase [Granulosicoccaceae sp. 1_MG-2023]|nr:phosphotransferase [Granulosicoccaceae sp. 1_MG-2023]